MKTRPKTTRNSSQELARSRSNKRDEFYTQLEDIEKEVEYHYDHFNGKVVLLNCDNPEESNFWVYFRDNFAKLGLKKLISTHYEEGKQSYKMVLEYDGNISKTPLVGDGDFRSEECIDILKEADIVVTNPPFSLFQKFITQLIEYDKKFLIIGNQLAVSAKEIFPLIRDGKVWYGASIHSHDREFRVPDDYPLNADVWRVDENGTKFVRVKGVRWFTNLNYPQRHDDLILTKHYTPEEYPKYDNYDAINVNKTKDIPCDYDGAMGVPLTFLDKYNPDQFEILNANDFRRSDNIPIKKHGLIKDSHGTVEGSTKPVFGRIVVRRKR